MTNLIKCPHCGKDIEVTEALTHSIRESMRNELEGELAKNEKEFAKQQTALKQKERELAAQQESIDEQVAEKVKAGQKLIAEAERKKILAEQAEQTKAIQEELEEKNRKLSDLQKQEIELRKKQRELEQKQQELELENQRTLDVERKKISEEAGQKASEEQQFKMKEKDDLIKAMQVQIETLKRRAESGSQEAQGEALEGALQDMLQQTFPFDLFEEVKKGQRGGDILQVVRNATGKECGKILWESKYTKDFQKGWIEKLKKDQQEAGAEIAVITTITLPKEIKNFGPLENVWITDFASAMGLSAALRMGLINAAREKALTENKETLKDVIYKYVTGQEFSMQIRAVAEAFIRMQGDLNKEKRAMERIWKSREKQIETVLSNLSGIRGSLEGYIGQKLLPSMETLSLEAIEADETETEV
jgi:hypothetical protein